jgi:hypothetical protein
MDPQPMNAFLAQITTSITLWVRVAWLLVLLAHWDSVAFSKETHSNSVENNLAMVKDWNNI